MKLLVLGCNGQVGWELRRSLAPLGEVVALSRNAADLEDAPGLRRAVLAVKPGIIVNAAAYTAVDNAESEPARADRINHLAAGELGAMAAELGAWLIHYSTDYVFDGTKPTAYIETDEPAPQGAYARSKHDGERAIAASGARHLIFRTSWVHSARGGNFIRTILRLAAERDELRVVADQYGAPTSAELIADVTAHAVAAIARNAAPAPGIYHLAAAGETSWHGLAQFVLEEAAGVGVGLRVAASGVTAIITAEYPSAVRRPANSRLDTTKLRNALGIVLPDWREGARRTVCELLGTASIDA